MKKVKRIKCTHRGLEKLYSNVENVTSEDNQVIRKVNEAMASIVRMDKKVAELRANVHTYSQKQLAAAIREYLQEAEKVDEQIHVLFDEANDIHAGITWWGDTRARWKIGSFLEESTDNTSSSFMVRNMRGITSRMLGLSAGVATGGVPGVLVYFATSYAARKSM